MRSRFSRRQQTQRHALIGQLVAALGVTAEDDPENFETATGFCQEHLAPHNNRFPGPVRRKVETMVDDLVDRFAVRTQTRSAAALRSLFDAFQKISVDGKAASEDARHGPVQLICLLSRRRGSDPKTDRGGLGAFLQEPRQSARGEDEAPFDWPQLRARLERSRKDKNAREFDVSQETEEDYKIAELDTAWEEEYDRSEDSSDGEVEIEAHVEPVSSMRPTPANTDYQARGSAQAVGDGVASLSLSQRPDWFTDESSNERVRAERSWEKLRGLSASSSRGLDVVDAGIPSPAFDPSPKVASNTTYILESVAFSCGVAALDGFPSRLFNRDPASQRFSMAMGRSGTPVASLRHVSDGAFCAALQAIANAASTLGALRASARTHMSSKSQCAQAFGRALQREVEAFEVELAGKVRPSRSPRTLLWLHCWVRSAVPPLAQLAQVVATAETRMGAGGDSAATSTASLLTTLVGALDMAGLCGAERTRCILARVLKAAVRPYARMLSSFLSRGETVDPGAEFLISQRKLRKKSPRFWEQALRPSAATAECSPAFLRGCASRLLLAGKAIRLVREVKEDGTASVPEFDVTDILTVFDEALEARGSGEESADEDASRGGVIDAKVPAEKANVETGPVSPFKSLLRPDAPEESIDIKALAACTTVSLAPRTSGPRAAVSSLGNRKLGSAAAAVYLPLDLSLSRVLMQKVVTRQREVGRAMMQALDAEPLALQSHLRALRKLFLMASGEIARHFTDSLFPRLASGRWPPSSVLNDILQDALRVDPEVEARLGGALRVSLAPLSRGSCPELDWIASLEFKCELRWPVSLVVSQRSLRAYGNVFRFLLQVRYAKWVLESLALLKSADSKRRGARPRELHAFFTLRAEMHHIVSSVQNYVSGRAVYGVWPRFLERRARVERQGDLALLSRAHDTYIGEVQMQLLLGRASRAAHNKVLRLLGVSVGLQGISRRQMEVARDQANSDIRFLLLVLKEIVRQGAQPHLRDLLLRLNFNRYFSRDVA